MAPEPDTPVPEAERLRTAWLDDVRRAESAFLNARHRPSIRMSDQGPNTAMANPVAAAQIYAAIRDAQRLGLPLLIEPDPSPFNKLELLLLRHIHTPDAWAAERLRIFTALCALSSEEAERRGRRL